MTIRNRNNYLADSLRREVYIDFSFFFALFTISYMKQLSVITKGENMSERVTADDVRHVETKIIMTEDKMFREKNYYKKLEIREEIIFLRKKLQKMQFLFKEG